MVILHIASIGDNKFNGVHVVVPQHLQAQQKTENVAILNLTNIAVVGAKRQFKYKKPFSVSLLPAPFSKPDLVVFHEIYRFDFVGISKQLRNSGIPYVIIPHGSLTREAQRKKWLKKMVANLLFFNAFIEGAAAIQFLSEKEKEQSPFGKIKFVGTNGVHIPDRQKESFSRGNAKLLYIGRIHWHIKGIDLMLSAIGRSAGELRKSGVILDLFGPFCQDKNSEVRRFIEKEGVADLVFPNDAIAGEVKTQKLLDSDIFIQTSRSEGMPMGVLEALSYGLPCLVTEGTSLGELIRKYDAGWVAKTDAESISTTIQQAIRERHLWERKSVNARKLIEDNFRWESIAMLTLKQYRIVTNGCNEDVIE